MSKTFLLMDICSHFMTKQITWFIWREQDLIKFWFYYLIHKRNQFIFLKEFSFLKDQNFQKQETFQLKVFAYYQLKNWIKLKTKSQSIIIVSLISILLILDIISILRFFLINTAGVLYSITIKVSLINIVAFISKIFI